MISNGSLSGHLSPMDVETFGPWLERWRLRPDGNTITGPNSKLLPVRRGDDLLMLKAAMQPREVRAAAYLDWLGGSGAVAVLERERDATLMERVTGRRSLAEIEMAGGAEEALAVLCGVGAALHAVRDTVPDEVVPLSSWLQRLTEVASTSEFFGRMAIKAQRLLSEEHDIRVLHGDLHHWNVLDGGDRGWLAIDPNGLRGERAFEFALMTLPVKLADDTDAGVLSSRSRIIARLARVDSRRLLEWLAVQAALWAAWSAPGRDWIAVGEAAYAAADM
jgi:streptomycin 6-kinase